MKDNQSGNAMLMSVLMISLMLGLIGSIGRTINMQYQLARTHKHTATTYTLAESAVEMFNQSINVLLEQSHSEITIRLHEAISQQLAQIEGITPDADMNEVINPKWVKLKYMQLVYEVITKEYFIKPDLSSNIKAKQIVYEIKNPNPKYITKIWISPQINAKGNSNTSITKQLVDQRELENLKDLKQYSSYGIDSLYNKVFLTEGKLSYKDALWVEVTIETRNEKGQVYSSEKVMSSIAFDNLDKIAYQMLNRGTDEIQPNDQQIGVPFELYIQHVPLRVEVRSIKTKR